MKLFHGSPTGGITALLPNKAEHGTAVFLTNIETLAALYAQGNHCWYTYCFTRERTLVYDEVFPDQFRRLHEGRTGYIYTVEAEEARQHERMPWVYMVDGAEAAQCRVIPDLYGYLQGEIAAGRLILRRYEDMPENVLASYRRMTVEHLVDNGFVNDPECEYARFVRTYMPELWEEAQQKGSLTEGAGIRPKGK